MYSTVRVVEERPTSLMLPLQELDRPAPGEHFRICGGEWGELSMTEVSLVPARTRRMALEYEAGQERLGMDGNEELRPWSTGGCPGS